MTDLEKQIAKAADCEKAVVDGDRVELTQMYEYVDLTLAKLEAIAALLGTQHINIEERDRDHEEGCDSCDYGSRYTLTLYVKGRP